MDFSEVIKNRYSCKKFSDVEVKKEKLDKILEAGHVAPTAKNLQEQHMVHIIIHNRIYSYNGKNPQPDGIHQVKEGFI